MRFTLTYRGPLPSEQQGHREEKHGIRRQIHPQIREWWRAYPPLARDFDPAAVAFRLHHETGPTVTKVGRVADAYRTFGFSWVPLVRRDSACSSCSLDILLLVRRPPFGAFNGSGDLDNRIKTLIDGLCRPKQRTQLPDGAAPQADEDPFFCLMEDDSLIYDFSVRLGQLLRPPEIGEAHTNAEALINVRVRNEDGGDPFSLTM